MISQMYSKFLILQIIFIKNFYSLSTKAFMRLFSYICLSNFELSQLYMKMLGIKILYRLFSFLSEHTNGFKPFVKYKLAFGILLVGFMTNNCKEPESQILCYDPVAVDTTEVTCYLIGPTKVVPPDYPVNDFREELPSIQPDDITEKL